MQWRSPPPPPPPPKKKIIDYVFSPLLYQNAINKNKKIYTCIYKNKAQIARESITTITTLRASRAMDPGRIGLRAWRS